MTANVHTHSTWCDGKDSPDAMAEAALALGFSGLGFSSHAPAPYDPRCPGVPSEPAYRQDIHRLKKAFEGRMNILCGIEQDYCGPVETESYDYVIGSRHYLAVIDGEYIAVDGAKEELADVVGARYGGDAHTMLREYYRLSAEGARLYHPDIVGHFDLVKKYNTGSAIFDEDSPEYQAIALEAFDDVLDTVSAYGGMVEVNTGAMARGLRQEPYPAPFLLRHAAQRHARMIITTDCHDKALLNYGFERALELLRQAGFASMAVLQNGGFSDVKI